MTGSVLQGEYESTLHRNSGRTQRTQMDSSRHEKLWQRMEGTYSINTMLPRQTPNVLLCKMHMLATLYRIASTVS